MGEVTLRLFAALFDVSGVILRGGEGGDKTGIGLSVKEGVRDADSRRGVETDLFFSGSI